MLLTILNWGAYGPDRGAACHGLAAGAAPPPNVLHAHCPGGPNPPGSAANPTLLPGGPAKLVANGGNDGGFNMTWQEKLQEILDNVFASAGKAKQSLQRSEQRAAQSCFEREIRRDWR
jgi:hypothetical protein